MLDKIRKYKIRDDISAFNLLRSGFKLNSNNVLSYYKPLIKSIGLFITLEDNKEWNWLNNLSIIDEDFMQPYTPFYSGCKEFSVLTEVIDHYHFEMDLLVSEGIMEYD